MSKTLAFIHTAHVLVPTFVHLSKRSMPDIEVFNIVDESLLKNTIKAGELTQNTVQRLINYVRSAKDGGADAVLVTCSSIGPAVEAARAVVDMPVLRIDDAMADEAVQRGKRIGVAATLRTTLDPTAALLKAKAAVQGRECEIVSRLCEGAFEAVTAGDPGTHDRIVSSNLTDLMQQVDVIVLAQASMARVIEAIPAEKRRVPILASPELAIDRAKRVMEQL